MKAAILLCALIAVVSLGCDSVELTIGVEAGPEATLLVSNENGRALTDVTLLVEAVESDNSTTVCVEHRVEAWQPDQTMSVPACGDKIRLTLTSAGETARFAYANGQLFRRFGRKEVPISS